jgi:hypothetical protein
MCKCSHHVLDPCHIYAHTSRVPEASVLRNQINAYISYESLLLITDLIVSFNTQETISSAKN